MSSAYDRHDLSEPIPRVYDSRDAASSVQNYMFVAIGVASTVRRPRNLLHSRCVLPRGLLTSATKFLADKAI